MIGECLTGQTADNESSYHEPSHWEKTGGGVGATTVPSLYRERISVTLHRNPVALQNFSVTLERQAILSGYAN